MNTEMNRRRQATLENLESAFFSLMQNKELPHEDGDYTWLFEYVAENKEIFSVYFKLAMPPEDSDYQSAFRRRGIYAVVKAWFEGGCHDMPSYMSDLLTSLVCR